MPHSGLLRFPYSSHRLHLEIDVLPISCSGNGTNAHLAVHGVVVIAQPMLDIGCTAGRHVVDPAQPRKIVRRRGRPSCGSGHQRRQHARDRPSAPHTRSPCFARFLGFVGQPTSQKCCGADYSRPGLETRENWGLPGDRLMPTRAASQQFGNNSATIWRILDTSTLGMLHSCAVVGLLRGGRWCGGSGTHAVRSVSPFVRAF
jgi:hypothetical protein